MSELAPIVFVIAGPNGAGKSTLAPVLLRDSIGVLDFINADTIAQGLSAFQPEKAAFEAGRIMLKRIHELAGQSVSFAFETTLATRSYAPMLKRLIEQGYKFHLTFLWLYSADLAIERVKERVQIGGHNIPEETIRRRYNHGLKNFFELYQSLATSWGIWDNSVSGSAKLIATGSTDSITNIAHSDLWKEINEKYR